MSNPDQATGDPNRIARQERALLESQFRIAFDECIEQLKATVINWEHQDEHTTTKVWLKSAPEAGRRKLTVMHSNNITRTESNLLLAEFADDGMLRILESYDEVDESARDDGYLKDDPTYRTDAEPTSADLRQAIASIRLVQQRPELAKLFGEGGHEFDREKAIGEFVAELNKMPDAQDPNHKV